MQKDPKKEDSLIAPKSRKKVRNNVHNMLKIGNDVFLLHKFLKMNKKKRDLTK